MKHRPLVCALALAASAISCTYLTQKNQDTPNRSASQFTSPPSLVFDLENGFFDAPFPSDARRLESGAPDFSRLPNPEGIGFVKNAVALSADLDGFDASGAMYFRFDKRLKGISSKASVLNTQSLPGIHFVDVDKRSPEYKREIPVWVRSTDHHDGVRPANLLQLLPVPGLPLRENNTYALVVESQVGQTRLAKSAVIESLIKGESDHPWSEAFAPLRNAKGDLKFLEKDIAAATVFTTGSPTKALRALSLRALTKDAPLTKDVKLDREYDSYNVVTGLVEIDLFQKGTPPFLFGGGEVELDEKGDLLSQGKVWAPFTLSIPKGEMPKDGFPLFFYLHGTGGKATQPIDRGRRKHKGDVPKPGAGLSSWMAPLGVATSCMAGAYSPDRIGWRAIDGYAAYAFTNPVAVKNNFKQMVLEQIAFLKLVETLEIDASILPGVTLPAGSTKVRISSTQRLVGGQSLGSYLSGMLASLTGAFDAALLTGAGGSWIEFAFGPKDPVDLEAVLNRFSLPFSESLDRHHPFMTVFENAIGEADNTHYTPFILGERQRREGEKIPHVLVVQGQRDRQIAVNLQRALTLSIGTDLASHDVGLREREQIEPVLHLGKLKTLPNPVSGNKVVDGKSITAATVRYLEDGKLDGHYVIFQRDDAKALYIDFVRDVLEGRVPSVKR